MINVANGDFVVPDESPALLRMPYIEFCGTIGFMCETIDSKTASRKFDM